MTIWMKEEICSYPCRIAYVINGYTKLDFAFIYIFFLYSLGLNTFNKYKIKTCSMNLSIHQTISLLINLIKK